MRSNALRHGLSFSTSSAALQSDDFFTISEYRVKQLRTAPWAWSQLQSLESLHRSSICWEKRSRLLTLIIQVTRLRSRGILIFCYLTTMELIKARSQKAKSDHLKQVIRGLQIMELQRNQSVWLQQPTACLISTSLHEAEMPLLYIYKSKWWLIAACDCVIIEGLSRMSGSALQIYFCNRESVHSCIRSCQLTRCFMLVFRWMCGKCISRIGC